MSRRPTLRDVTGAVRDGDLWRILVPLFAAPVAALLLVGVLGQRTGGAAESCGAGPDDRAELAAFLDAAFASARAHHAVGSTHAGSCRFDFSRR